VGWEVTARTGDRGSIGGIGLVGGSYTFGDGATLAVEYVHNSRGYNSHERALQDALSADLGPLATGGDPRAGLALAILGRAADPGNRLLGRNYLFAQFVRRGLGGSLNLNLVLRYTLNLDEGSGLIVSIIEREIGARAKLFMTSLVSHGGARSEIGRFMRYQAVVGTRVVLR
jgi:hypothetical protein